MVGTTRRQGRQEGRGVCINGEVVFGIALRGVLGMVSEPGEGALLKPYLDSGKME